MKRAYSLACLFGGVYGGLLGHFLGGIAGMFAGMVGGVVCGAVGVLISRFLYRTCERDTVIGAALGLAMSDLFLTYGCTATVSPAAAVLSVGIFAAAGGIATYGCC
ncbi:hypothetical protein ACIBI3_22280 [Actinomadura luteofluorescens]|uniref:hypothetical protein n=1 Tax=Actinomadura luteofluorescens TaxID=46163 RepID=UPI0034854C9B